MTVQEAARGHLDSDDGHDGPSGRPGEPAESSTREPAGRRPRRRWVDVVIGVVLLGLGVVGALRWYDSTAYLVVVLDAATGKIASGPEITARGFVEDDEIFQQVIPKVERAIEEAVAKGVRDDQQLQQVIRRAVGSWVGGKIRRRPMIIPVVLQA